MVVVAPHLILGFALSVSGFNLSAVLRSEVGIVKYVAILKEHNMLIHHISALCEVLLL